MLSIRVTVAFQTASASRVARDVVHPHDAGPVLHGDQRAGDAGGEALTDRAPGHRAEHGLARQPGEHRQPARAEARELAQQRVVVLDALAEAEAGIEHDALARHARSLEGRHALVEEADHLADHVGVPRILLHRARLAAACASRTARHSPAATASIAPGARKALMSLIMSAPAASAARITAGFTVSIDSGTFQSRARLDEADHALEFLRLGHRIRARPGGLGADVEHLRALLQRALGARRARGRGRRAARRRRRSRRSG